MSPTQQFPIYRSYAGIGPKDAPADILTLMTHYSSIFSSLNFTLRTNGSEVPGIALEKGAKEVELYLPWKKFNKRESRFCNPIPAASEIAKRFHPVFDKMKDPVKLIIANESHVVLGENLRDPIKFLLVWTPDGVTNGDSCSIKTGTPAQSIKISSAYGIPVFNLANKESRVALEEFIKNIRKNDQSLDEDIFPDNNTDS